MNAALVPAALDATARLLDSGLLDEYLDVDQLRTLKAAREAAQIWATQAPRLFNVDVSAARARQDIAAYAKRNVMMRDGLIREDQLVTQRSDAKAQLQNGRDDEERI